MAKKREYGAEQPYLKAGPFKVRVPFVHYRFEWQDYLQGLIMCCVCLSAIPMLEQYLGMPFEIAFTIVVLNGILYCLHVLLGDPVVPGWVTPAIPLLMLYVSQYEMGPDRLRALIAFELLLGVLAFVLGITGFGKKLVSLIPISIQSGLIVGSGVAAVLTVFNTGQRFDTFPITITICIGIAFFLLFSNRFKYWAKTNKVAEFISNLGIFPIMILAVFLGPIVGETIWPTIEFGPNADGLFGIISTPDFAGLFKEWTFFNPEIGFPGFPYFIKAIPMVFSAYVILFGDMIQANALLQDAAKKRPDEKVDYNPNRSHMIFGLRNVIMSVLGPDVTMCGPLWAAMQVVETDRYKHGRGAMDSINGGCGFFRLGTLTGYFILPIVAFVTPILGIALASTMLIQGYVSFRVGVQMSRNFNDIGIAGVMAAIIAIKGATWGLAVGIVLYILIQTFNKKEFDEPLLTADAMATADEAEEKIAEENVELIDKVKEE
ncbi:MAG: hypothetical protein LBD41_05545 [Clostridiales Family XIII bacterium]|nr:hypothetical protein [Clostridiales Family XIII bacterium]